MRHKPTDSETRQWHDTADSQLSESSSPRCWPWRREPTSSMRSRFPDSQIFLRVIAIRAPYAFLSFQVAVHRFLFTTPYMVICHASSGLYIFTLRTRWRDQPGQAPSLRRPAQAKRAFPGRWRSASSTETDTFETPFGSTIPERGCSRGIAIFGAIGSGKTSCAMYPFAEQILAYKADDEEKRIGGLILEVKGDFCRKVQRILDRQAEARTISKLASPPSIATTPCTMTSTPMPWLSASHRF